MISAPAMGVTGSATADARSADSPAACSGSWVHSAGMRWHCVRAGQGPRILLLHGTGSSSGSWSRMIPLLAERFEVLAPDLPGHARSGALPSARAGLDAYAQAVASLVSELGAWPDLIVGHSAGAAIAARMALEPSADRVAVLSINGALRPLAGWTAATFVPLAKLLGLSPFLPGLVVSLVASDGRAVRRLLDATGSRIDPGMVALYDQLLRSPAHVAGTLRMLAGWDLRGLVQQLPRLGPRLTLIAGAADRTVAPHDAQWVQQRVPGSTQLTLQSLGHLAHEEAPERIAAVVVSVARGRGLLDDAPPGAQAQR